MSDAPRDFHAKITDWDLWKQILATVPVVLSIVLIGVVENRQTRAFAEVDRATRLVTGAFPIIFDDSRDVVVRARMLEAVVEIEDAMDATFALSTAHSLLHEGLRTDLYSAIVRTTMQWEEAEAQVDELAGLGALIGEEMTRFGIAPFPDLSEESLSSKSYDAYENEVRFLGALVHDALQTCRCPHVTERKVFGLLVLLHKTDISDMVNSDDRSLQLVAQLQRWMRNRNDGTNREMNETLGRISEAQPTFELIADLIRAFSWARGITYELVDPYTLRLK